MGSYPSCTVTVYPHGSTTPVSGTLVYSDSSGDVLGNPFTATADGSFTFWITTGQYDVCQSGNLPSQKCASVQVFDFSAGYTAEEIWTFAEGAYIYGGLVTNVSDGTLNVDGYPNTATAVAAASPLGVTPVNIPSSTSISDTAPCHYANLGSPVAGDGCESYMGANVFTVDHRWGWWQHALNVGNWYNGAPVSTGQYPAALDDCAYTKFSLLNPWASWHCRYINQLILDGGLNQDQDGFSNQTTYNGLTVNQNKYTEGNAEGIMVQQGNESLGDHAAMYSVQYNQGTFSGGSGEGTTSLSMHNYERPSEFGGTVTSDTGTAVTVGSVLNDGLQGAGRWLYNITAATSGTLASITHTNTSTPLAFVATTPTNYAVSTVNTTSTTAVVMPGVSYAITPVSMTNITTSTVLCIASPGNFETVIPSSTTGSTFTATFHYPHASGFIVAAGGLCGWGISLNADIANSTSYPGITFSTEDGVGLKEGFFPIISSTSGTTFQVWNTNPGGYQTYTGWFASSGTAPNGLSASGYNLYPIARVTSVASVNKLSDTLQTMPHAAWSTGAAIGQAHYFNANTASTIFTQQQFGAQGQNAGASEHEIDFNDASKFQTWVVNNNTFSGLYNGVHNHVAPRLFKLVGAWGGLAYWPGTEPTGPVLDFWGNSNTITLAQHGNSAGNVSQFMHYAGTGGVSYWDFRNSATGNDIQLFDHTGVVRAAGGFEPPDGNIQVHAAHFTQSVIVSAPSLTAGAAWQLSGGTAVTWPVAFADTNYSASCIIDQTLGTGISAFVANYSLKTTGGITVFVTNGWSTGNLSGAALDCTATSLDQY